MRNTIIKVVILIVVVVIVLILFKINSILYSYKMRDLKNTPHFTATIELKINNKNISLNENVAKFKWIQGSVKSKKDYLNSQIEFNDSKYIINEPIYGGPKIEMIFEDAFISKIGNGKIRKGLKIIFGDFGNFSTKSDVILKIEIDNNIEIINVSQKDVSTEYQNTNYKSIKYNDLLKNNVIEVFDGI